MFGCYQDWISVRGGSGGASFQQSFADGRVTMSGTDFHGIKFKHQVLYENGRIADRKYIEDGKVKAHLVYGSYEKDEKGNIVRFKKGTKKSKHGKARTFENLFGKPGVCHSWYSSGRLVKQTFVYDNGVRAYLWDLKSGTKDKPTVVRDYYGKSIVEIKGRLKSASNNAFEGSHSVLSGDMKSWFAGGYPFEVKKDGKVIFAGKEENRQRVGKWIEDGVTGYYEHGVLIPEKLYNTPVEKLNPVSILKIKNAQLRMALMSKFEPDRIAKCGRVIDTDKGKNDMILYDIPNYDVRILRVRCHTTKSLYYLRVPKDSKKCEAARQWTFGVGETFNKPIKFEVET